MNELFLRDNQKPISIDLLSQLPRSRFNAGSASQQAAEVDASERQCTICMTDYSDNEEMLTLPCFHKFHAGCVETWFKSQNWCPICRTKIDEQAR